MRVDTRNAGGGAGDRGRDRRLARGRARCAGAARVVWLLARGGGPDAGCSGGHVQGPVAPRAETLARETECGGGRSEEHTSELQSPCNLVCRLLLEKKKNPVVRIAVRAQATPARP